MLLGGALVVLVALVGSAAPRAAVQHLPLRGFLAVRADTDSVAVDVPRAVQGAADSTARADTARARLYLPSRQDRSTASLFQRRTAPLSVRLGNYWRHELSLDSTGHYVAREMIGGKDVRYPLRLSREDYRQARLEEDLSASWRSLAAQRARLQQQQRRGGLGLNIVVPGGRQSAFSTIFGKPQVDLRVTGQANILGGFNYRKSDQQVFYTGQASRTDPTFKQDLSLGITGSIGDKLRVDVSWDTGNQFDYQNQLKLVYTGYEDEIIQSIEAGNVYLQTPSTLIRGGQSLFGIKSQFQIGGVRLTTVASQQEGQSNNLSISGGSQTVEFDLKPTDYDDRTHFFLSYYFRNRWEEALSSPPNIILNGDFERITDIEVWKLQHRSADEEDVRYAISMVDLGEDPAILAEADAYTGEVLPGPGRDQYSDGAGGDLASLREDATRDLLEAKGLQAFDYQEGQFKLLERGRDYEIDPVLGYVSLRQRLQESEALAVSYRYVRSDGTVVQVGDFSSETGGARGGQTDARLILKLLRPVNLRQPAGPDNNPAAWYLELRNIYRLRSYGINPNDFDLQVFYEPPGEVPVKTLPSIGGRRTLLQMLGLDRLNADQAVSPDDRFDYLVNFTIDPGRGLLIFPYLEPFGGRILGLIEQENLGQEQADQLKNRLVYTNLYKQKQEQAKLDTQRNVYRIQGSYKGAIQSFYDLGAYAGLIEGSVRVTSGGTPLQEGADYTVDYQGGTVTVTNPSYLSAGRDINITYEQNQFVNFQKKTLLGARADYSLGEQLDLGATVMRLSQKSPVDKFRLGEEPLSNTIWGVDGRVDLQPRWLTRAVDALPFIQTKAPSAITITGEFAQLRPGHVETIAFEQARQRLTNSGRDFRADELSGISYIDDFEGFETTYSLKQPGAWLLSAPPDSIGAIDQAGVLPGLFQDSLRAAWRGTFAWYQPNVNVLKELGYDNPYAAPADIRIYSTQEIFPNKITDVSANTIATLDLYFNPRERGPYNYTTDLRGFLQNPKYAWGGITQRLPEGYNDFNLKNIEFVEFVFRPFAEGRPDAGPDARLYVDLGFISEDIVPDQKLNIEDGLSTTLPVGGSISNWSRLASGMQNTAVDIDAQTGLTEDLGLDGMASYTRDAGLYGAADERTHFSRFLDAVRAVNCTGDPLCQAEVAKALADPSGDDYHYFGDDHYFDPASGFYPNGATVQQRFSRFFPGLELNSYEGQNKLAENTSVKRGNARYPDSEDLNLNSTIDTENSYFQYELPLSKAVLDEQALEANVDDYVVTQIADNQGNPTGWYQVRIPVRDFTRKVGNIEDFSSIQSIRLWTTGHQVPATIRFATFELVGSQWQKAPEVAEEPQRDGIVLPDTTARLTISSINDEENNNVYASPTGAILSQIRGSGGLELLKGREQAMVLRVEHLQPGQQRAIYKTFAGLDLLKYQYLRMFIHMHGRLAGIPSGYADANLGELAKANLELARSKARVFVRIGANATNDYYEYEQPLTPSPDPQQQMPPDILWQSYVPYGSQSVDLNSLSLDLGALNKLKVSRDEATGARRDSIFWNVVETPNGPVRQGPDLGESAPPGTRIGIKGNPSLDRINTIVIGIRNPADPGGPLLYENVLEDVTVWINELRTSGYDSKPGHAGLMNADIRLADLGRIKANFSTQSDGFGELASTLDDRDQTSLNNWGIITDVNLDKFIPERYGWSLPINVQLQSNTSTPRFSPQRGDVRLDEILAQIEEQEDLSPVEKELAKQEALEATQAHAMNRSFTARVQKTGSESRLLRNTLDGLTASYSYGDSDGRSPSQRINDSWRWQGTLNYRLNIRKPRTVQILGFLEGLPLLGVLSDLQFNYVPQNITLSGIASRNFAQTKDRPRGLQLTPLQANPLLDPVAYPMREQHAFGHRRNFGLQYNPFGFLNLSFDTNVNQSLNTLGADTLFSVIALDEQLGDYVTYAGLREGDWDKLAEYGITPDDFENDRAFEVRQLEVLSTGNVVSGLFEGRGPRTERYESRFSSTFQPKFNRLKALDWITFNPVTYGVNFSWQNGAVGRNAGASIGNQVDVRGGISFQPQNFWRKFDFYKKLEQEQREAEQKAQAERQQQEQERQRRREQRRREREQERLKEAGGEEEAGQAEAPPEDMSPEERAEWEEREYRERMERQQRERMEAEQQGRAPAVSVDAAPAAGQDEAQEEDGGFRLPLPDPDALLRQAILAVTGIRDFRITYSGNRSSNSTNVGHPIEDGTVAVHHSLLDAFRGNGPSIGYRFGLDRTIPQRQRILDSKYQVGDVLSDANRVQAQTTLNPTRSLQVNLNWNTDWTDSENITYRVLQDQATGAPLYDAFGNLQSEMVSTQNGINKASIWAFRADYLDLFERQLNTYIDDYEQAVRADSISDYNGDGRMVLTNGSVVEDFRAAFLSGLGTLDGRGLLPFPMPTWSVNYSGISNWPFIRRLVQSATLRHGYSADYTTNFRSNLAGQNGTLGTINLGRGKRILAFGLPAYEVSTIRINERYQPLIGLDLAWKGRLQTNIAWNKSNSYGLGTANNEVGELKTNELTMTASYQRQGMSIPFLPGKRLNNRISFSFTLSLSQTSDRRYNLRSALEEAILLDNPGGFNLEDAVTIGKHASEFTATNRLSVSPKISYMFSNRVSSDFTLRYEKFQSANSRDVSFSALTGNFNVRVSISN